MDDKEIELLERPKLQEAKETKQSKWSILQQPVDTPVDVSGWDGPTNPVGTRVNRNLFSPEDLQGSSFLQKNHYYCFKQSIKRYPEEFWMEIFAYLLGKDIGIKVPPTFVAFNRLSGKCGALSEFFYKEGSEDFHKGGDYFNNHLEKFDRKKGTQHNINTLFEIFDNLVKNEKLEDRNWKEYWSEVFLFDALIGNTDRHQDNWGIIENKESFKKTIAPVFDNGTSMGREIYKKKFQTWKQQDYDKYISKGFHHIRVDIESKNPGHYELLHEMMRKYNVKKTMLNLLNKVNIKNITKILEYLTKFDIPVKLTTERANFMLKLIENRYDKLKKGVTSNEFN
ncbi:HipA domain-containing protein [Rickettsiella massiliensis]|uniref:HipA domain-containing protein n=1 Tax=Rickettsiella massiliensis TaxID=676517 RepID=UPI00029A0E1D|nr:HipA domain-containing protein [Rickettsiella massiliensis]